MTETALRVRLRDLQETVGVKDVEIARLKGELSSLQRRVGITPYPRDDRGDDTAADQ